MSIAENDVSQDGKHPTVAKLVGLRTQGSNRKIVLFSRVNDIINIIDYAQSDGRIKCKAHRILHLSRLLIPMTTNTLDRIKPDISKSPGKCYISHI
jgi:hypothetical protein